MNIFITHCLLSASMLTMKMLVELLLTIPPDFKPIFSLFVD